MIKTYETKHRGACALEDTDLINIVSWFDYQLPHLSPLLIHVPNESDMPVQGRVKAKKKGVRKGVPDLMLLKGNSKYSGLMLELKRQDRTKSKVSVEQDAYAQELSEQGFFCAFCYGFDEAKKCIEEYLQIK